ncbi:MAG: tetratricopeptide repeat protein [Firmicutes bacterium]|nr:tetratricopeptide repeat protein [Bacillota bacterium]
MDEAKKQFAGTLSREDYEEPRCLLNMADPNEAPVHAIDMRRVVEKLDEYQAKKDWAGAERHLEFWLGEARLGNDKRGEFSVRNEMMGYYRKRGNEAKAVESAEKALAMIPLLGYEDAVSGATCYVNSATVYQAFGKPETALGLFEQAKPVYERNLAPDDGRLGGLYNNMALSYVATRRYGEAYESYKKALAVMERAPGGTLEQALTYLNMADAVAAEHGLEKGEKKIAQYLDRAEELLAASDPETHPELAEVISRGYYAFCCECAAPTFGYYGYFLAAKRFAARAEAITKQLK